MKVKSIGTNKTEIAIHGYKLLVSYKTPVAAIKPTGHGIKTDMFHSVTTTKHINSWFQSYNIEPGNVPEIPQHYFDSMLE